MILKIISFHYFSVRAAWAGHWLLGWLKQLWGGKSRKRRISKQVLLLYSCVCMYYVICILPMHFWPSLWTTLYITQYYLADCRLWTTGWILNTMSTLCIGGICILKMWQDLYLLAVAVKNISYSFYIPDTMDKWSYHVQCTEIAICSPNCVQIWKGRDRKMGFFRMSHKKCWANSETFLCQTL